MSSNPSALASPIEPKGSRLWLKYLEATTQEQRDHFDKFDKTPAIRLPTNTPSDLSDNERYLTPPEETPPPIVPPRLQYNRRQLYKKLYKQDTRLPNNYGWFKASPNSDILFKLPEKKGLRFDECLDVAKEAYRFRRFRLFSKLKKRFDQELRELNTRRSIIDALVRDIDNVHYDAYK